MWEADGGLFLSQVGIKVMYCTEYEGIVTIATHSLNRVCSLLSKSALLMELSKNCLLQIVPTSE